MPANNLRHGDSHTRFHDIWRDMNGRCKIKSKTSYKNYGGRGITVCKRWEKYEMFKKDMYATYQQHVVTYSERQTTLDRIKVNGNYSKQNCRWATYRKQARNTRRTHWITIGNVKKSMQEWSEIFNMNPDLVERRINKRKWNAIKALTTLSQKHDYKKIT